MSPADAASRNVWKLIFSFWRWRWCVTQLGQPSPHGIQHPIEAYDHPSCPEKHKLATSTKVSKNNNFPLQNKEGSVKADVCENYLKTQDTRFLQIRVAREAPLKTLPSTGFLEPHGQTTCDMQCRNNRSPLERRGPPTLTQQPWSHRQCFFFIS